VREVDYLIVGQGLAGSVVACLLQMAGRRVLVIDNALRTAASLSAAGIVSPITGKRSRIAIFNGLGSKGALQAPFASKQLIDNLEKGRPIHPEFDVCRRSLWQQPQSA
jgi:glycine/D-amino acid oxidase-like deaminating enzyme